MTYPENIPPGSTAFDLAATAGPGAQPLSHLIPDEMPDYGVPLTEEAHEAWDRYREDPIVDPDCRAGKHTSCVGPPCQCAHHAVEVAVARFNELAMKYGSTKAAVMLLTHLSSEDIDAVGGVA